MQTRNSIEKTRDPAENRPQKNWFSNLSDLFPY
jgi:hypothetical protein